MDKGVGKQFVSDLKDKDPVDSIFLAKEKMILTDKNGRIYMSLNLADVTGAIDAKVWEKAEQLAPIFQPGDFVGVKGHIQLFQNRRQMVIHDIKKASPEEIQLQHFVAGATRNPAEMYRELISIIDSIENPHIRSLLEEVVKEERNRERLLVSPAAKTIHHASIGGLLEHILSISGIMNSLALHYPFLNRDYLLFGAIFHDIGKIWELEVGAGVQYTDAGRLVGHMGIACQMIDDKAAKTLGFPASLRDELKHIVLSHHGKLEYGSPKRPKFLEALVVSMIDELDSKINTMVEVLRAELEQGDKWTRFNQQFDRYLYLDIFRARLAQLKSDKK
jgi:3'-5' exoribonuclease